MLFNLIAAMGCEIAMMLEFAVNVAELSVDHTGALFNCKSSIVASANTANAPELEPVTEYEVSTEGRQSKLTKRLTPMELRVTEIGLPMIGIPPRS